MVAALDGLGEFVAGVVVLEGRVHTRVGGAVDDDNARGAGDGEGVDLGFDLAEGHSAGLKVRGERQQDVGVGEVGADGGVGEQFKGREEEAPLALEGRQAGHLGVERRVRAVLVPPVVVAIARRRRRRSRGEAGQEDDGQGDSRQSGGALHVGVVVCKMLYDGWGGVGNDWVSGAC